MGTDGPRMDASGTNQLCEVCGRQLHKVKHHRPYGPGRACRSHEEHSKNVMRPIIRTKRPYDTLQPTQKWKRRKQAREAVAQVLNEIGVPLQAIAPSSTPSPAELIHLPTSVREQIRTVPSLHIPSEQSMIQCKKLLATTHAT
jgi:hypothetical protein